jgi:sigma-B regulation protein RsbU (phosphoserine phosphatase)
VTIKLEQIPNHERDILIVDDHEAYLDIMEDMLQEEGYSIRKARSGRQALEKVGERIPDLVIMDVRMGAMDGFQACREIKSNHGDQFIPVILMTGLEDTGSKVKGFDAGADDYLVKPPDQDELLARVRAMLRIRDLHYNLLQSKRELENANLNLLKAQRVIEVEYERVGNIQRSFLPARFPQHPGVRFGTHYQPCERAGGDYFDLIEIGKQRWGLLVADVTGHGTPAAVVMAMTHVLMHSFSKSFHYPSTALKVVNEKLNQHLAPTIYVTMFYGILNLDKMMFRYASAGHETMMLYSAREHQIICLRTEWGFPLKLMENDDYDEREVNLEPGDKLILFTDGLVEARNERKEMFTRERLQEAVLKYHDLPAQPFVDAIIADLKAYCGKQSLQDDITMFVLEIMEPPEN